MDSEFAVEKKSLWLNRDYLLLWSGQAISSFGSAASHIVLPLLILDLTHSPAQAGLVGAVATIPYVVLSLFAGVFVDRWNRKKVMMVCEIARALVSGSIFLAILYHHISLAQIYIAALLEGLFFVFFDLSEIASLRQIVGKDQVSTASSQSFATDGLASLLGPSIGTAFYQVRQFVPFLLDAVSYLISLLTLHFISSHFQEERVLEEKKIRKELMEGISWLFKNKVIRFMALLNAGVSFIFADLMLIIIVLAKEQFASPSEIGLIVSISAIGSILGSLFGNVAKKRFKAGQVIISACWIQALVWPLYIFASNFVFIGIITAVITFVNSAWAIVQISYRLSLIPDELQGRVNSVFRFLAYSVGPVGMALTGAMLQVLGAKPTVMVFFIGLLACALAASLSKELRKAQSA